MCRQWQHGRASLAGCERRARRQEGLGVLTLRGGFICERRRSAQRRRGGLGQQRERRTYTGSFADVDGKLRLLSGSQWNAQAGWLAGGPGGEIAWAYHAPACPYRHCVSRTWRRRVPGASGLRRSREMGGGLFAVAGRRVAVGDDARWVGSLELRGSKMGQFSGVGGLVGEVARVIAIARLALQHGEAPLSVGEEAAGDRAKAPPRTVRQRLFPPASCPILKPTQPSLRAFVDGDVARAADAGHSRARSILIRLLAAHPLLAPLAAASLSTFTKFPYMNNTPQTSLVERQHPFRCAMP